MGMTKKSNIYRSVIPGLTRNPVMCALYGIAAQGRDDRLTFLVSPILTKACRPESHETVLQ